jgi:hypothetical protein
MNWRAQLAVFITVVLLIGCKSSQQPRLSSTPSETNPGKIRITITGDIRHPGRYWVSNSVSLADLPIIAGGWGGHGEFSAPPSRAIVTNSTANPNYPVVIYHLRKLSVTEQVAIHFRDGDVIRFPAIIF